MVESATRQLIESVRKFVKFWFWDEVTEQDDEPSSEEEIDTMMGISRSATNVWTLLSTKRTFISVEEKWFWTYVTDALEAFIFINKFRK